MSLFFFSFTDCKDQKMGCAGVESIVHIIHFLNVSAENVPEYEDVIGKARNKYPNSRVWKDK